jgi:hypothetical protein
VVAREPSLLINESLWEIHLELPRNGVVLCERHTITTQDDLPLEHTETRYAVAWQEFGLVQLRESSDLAR